MECIVLNAWSSASIDRVLSVLCGTQSVLCGTKILNEFSLCACLLATRFGALNGVGTLVVISKLGVVLTVGY